ncbi:hypothetical protein LCGC14_2142500 [marine sediment metagenome]|uniref:Uncharacterized protein n=1 Tax=marine sediment metagenome TaxID=412755 RepID=A0A0F9GB13_9ZZZZ
MPHIQGHELGDIFRDILGENPRAVFEAALSRLSLSPFQMRFFQDEFDPIQREFQGGAAAVLEQGAFPTETFSESLKQFPFLRRFMSRSPAARGDISTRLLAPSLTFAPSTVR